MNKQYDVLRELGKRIAEIAALPVQEEKKRLWTANNDLHPIRPMVYLDQLPWHELNKEEEMRLECQDPFLRNLEQKMREILYRWKYFPCDMVVENRIDIPRNVHGLQYGIQIKDEIKKTEEENDIVSHRYLDQLENEEQLEQLKPDEIWVDTKLDNQQMELAEEIFGGIIPVAFSGVQIHAGVWDRIAQMRPAEAILWDLVDRPEFIEQTVEKFVQLTISTVEQCEKLGILDEDAQYVHCTGAYTNDIQKTDGKNHHASNVWAFGMAQLFSTVSPSMHEEFEIDLVRPLYEKFGMMYYGCCEPLEKKIDLIRKINNVRKISISPWADPVEAAEKMGRDYVMSLKSNPAFIAAGIFEEDRISEQIRTAADSCRKSNTPLEIILKDVSTVSGKIEYLNRWAKLAMEAAENF